MESFTFWALEVQLAAFTRCSLAFFSFCCRLGREILCEFPVSLGQKTTRDWVDQGSEGSSESSRLHLKIYLYPLWRPPPHSDAFLQENVVSKYSAWTFSSLKKLESLIPTKIFIEIFSETLSAGIFMLKLFQQLRKRKTVRDTTALILIKVALKIRVNLSLFRSNPNFWILSFLGFAPAQLLEHNSDDMWSISFLWLILQMQISTFHSFFPFLKEHL